MTTRRTFIKTSSVALVGSSLIPACTPAAKEQASGEQTTNEKATDELVGLQLYSVREDMRNDPLGTLQKLSEMGYRFVEHAGYQERKFYGYAPDEFKKVLADLGMSMPSGHNVLKAEHWDDAVGGFTDEWKYTVEDVVTAGGEYIISPWLDKALYQDMDMFLRFMDVFNKCGELCKSMGGLYGYHNHAFEFDTQLEGMTLFDQILTNTEADLVIQQLDIGNMYNGGARAMDVIKKWPGRFLSMHVKDEIKSEDPEREDYESTILGNGVIGIKEVIDEGRKSAGTKHFIIEQEAYQGLQPIDCMKTNLERMKGWGYT